MSETQAACTRVLYIQAYLQMNTILSKFFGMVGTNVKLLQEMPCWQTCGKTKLCTANLSEQTTVSEPL